MNLNFFSQINLIDILTIIISVFALIATLRKKEFGKFSFVKINNPNVRNDVWIKVIKSDIYDLSFKIKTFEKTSSRLKLFYPDNSETVLFFLDENQLKFAITELKAGSKLEFTDFNFDKIDIRYTDKYNNSYTQTLIKDKIGNRKHKNIWNLTFIGS